MYAQPSLSVSLLLPNFLLPERKNQSSESISSSHFLSAQSVCRLCIKAHGFFCIYAHLTRTSAHRSASPRRAFMSFILLKPLLLFRLRVSCDERRRTSHTARAVFIFTQGCGQLWQRLRWIEFTRNPLNETFKDGKQGRRLPCTELAQFLKNTPCFFFSYTRIQSVS